MKKASGRTRHGNKTGKTGQYEDHFRVLIEQSRDGIVRYDLEHRYLYANPAIVKIYRNVTGKIDWQNSS